MSKLGSGGNEGDGRAVLGLADTGDRWAGLRRGAADGAFAGSAIGIGAALGLLAGASLPAQVGWRTALWMAAGTALLYATFGWVAGLAFGALRLGGRLGGYPGFPRYGLLVSGALAATAAAWWILTSPQSGTPFRPTWVGWLIAATVGMAALIAFGPRLPVPAPARRAIVAVLGASAALALLWRFHLAPAAFTAIFGLLSVVPLESIAGRSRSGIATPARGIAHSLASALALGLALVVGAFVAWHAAAASRPPVIIISIDAWRVDHAGPCSTTRLTPNADRLARDAVVFERAYSPAPWTFSSLAAMQTSKYPSACGISRPLTGPAPEYQRLRLAPNHTTIAEMMRDAGYATAFAGANPWLARYYGVARGFSYSYETGRGATIQQPSARPSRDLAAAFGSAAWHVWHGSPPRPYRTGGIGGWAAGSAMVTDEAIRALKARTGPPFLWVHFLDPHDPYLPHRPWPSEPPDWRSRTLGIPPRPVADARTWVSMSKHELPLTAADRDLVKRLYAGEVAQADAYVGQLLRHLRDAGIYDRALIILTSDHGEEHWDHGGYRHGHALHEEILRIPLIVKLPCNRRAGLRVKTPVSLLDVAPTVAEVAGVTWKGSHDGKSLLGVINARGGHRDQRPLYAEAMMEGKEQRSLLLWPYKVIWTPDDRKWEFYDLSRDSAERTNLNGTNNRNLARLRERLMSWAHTAAPGAAEPARGPALDEATRERLRALGYVR